MYKDTDFINFSVSVEPHLNYYNLMISSGSFWHSLMKASHKMVSRCMYLNILLQTKSHDILNRYVYIHQHRTTGQAPL